MIKKIKHILRHGFWRSWQGQVLGLAASAFLFSLSFPNMLMLTGWPWAAWIFSLPLLAVLDQHKLLMRCLWGWTFAILAYSLSLSWMFSYNKAGYFLLVLTVSVQGLIFAGLYHWFSGSRLSNVLYIPSAWVVSEYIRKLLMLGESWDLAHSQAFLTPIIQIERFVTSAGLSFCLILVNACLFNMIKEPENRKYYLSWILGVGIILTGLGYGTLFESQDQTQKTHFLRVGVLQPNTDFTKPLDDRDVNVIVEQNILQTANAVNREPADLVVWPETAIAKDYIHDRDLRNQIARFVQNLKTPLLIGAVFKDKTGKHNSAFLYDVQGNVRQVYHKRYLVPLTEYLPAGVFWTMMARVFHIEPLDFTPGREELIMDMAQTKKGAKGRLGIAICSENNIASVYRQYARHQAQAVIILMNYGWFSQTFGYVMSGQCAITHAVESGVAVLRATNTGWTCLINKEGQTQMPIQEQFFQTRFFYFDLPLAPHKTLANFLGDTFCLACLVFVIMLRARVYCQRLNKAVS